MIFRVCHVCSGIGILTCFLDDMGPDPRGYIAKWRLPSGSDVNVVCELENGPVEIVDLPIEHGDVPVCFQFVVYAMWQFTRGYLPIQLQCMVVG